MSIATRRVIYDGLTSIHFNGLEFEPDRVQGDEDQDDPYILDYGQELWN